MKIAIVSDSHDNLPNIEKALEFISSQRIAALIHCGDVCAPATLKFIAEHFSGQIHLCFGNVDGDKYNMTRMAFEDFHNVKIHGEVGEIVLGGKKLAFVHYPYAAKGLAAEGKYDLVFYGHDHKPWEEMIGKTKIVNPGNLANIFYTPTFAIFDTEAGKLELKILAKI
ncbi:MAG: YfcE family phosphodiesterase [Patescibacteria group bacterium]